MRLLLAGFIALAATFGFTSAAQADPPKPPCQPGQQGNQEPGFKPGSCDNARIAQAPAVVPFGRDVPITGQAKNGRKFTGTFHIDEFAARGGQVVAVGDLVGKLSGKGGKAKGAKKVRKYNVAIPVSGLPAAGQARAAIACNVLNLVLGPLDLNVLGLRVQLNQVKLDLTAIPGGGLLGDLLCGLAGGPGPLGSVIAALNGLLSGILGILNGLFPGGLPIPAP